MYGMISRPFGASNTAPGATKLFCMSMTSSAVDVPSQAK